MHRDGNARVRADSDLIASYRVAEDGAPGEIEFGVILTSMQKIPHRGVQVGRFVLARNAFGNETRGIDGAFPLRDWVVYHVPTGRVFASADDRADAQVIADDVSRFSREDPCSDERDTYYAQLGTEVRAWQIDLLGGSRAFSFRAWQRATSLVVVEHAGSGAVQSGEVG